MTHVRLTIALSALAAASASAQQPEPPAPPQVFIMLREGAGAGLGLGMAESKFQVEMAMESKVVKGAPYSAQALSETTQVLADGTRISRKTSTTLARDSEGRTRREENLSSVGPWSTAGQSHAMVFINDPVSQSNYVLDSSEHTGHKTAARGIAYRERASVENGSAEDSARVKKMNAERHALSRAIRAKEQGNVKTESLGNQTIAGIAATGTRQTRTIPAGEIGNDRPIDIVSETWYSDDLQMVVMSRHSDPRSGETTYTLHNIQRAEPPASLFTVPADYTVQENSDHMMVRKTAR